MDVLAERLDTKLRQWKPATAEQVRQWVAEIEEEREVQSVKPNSLSW
jgi:hypothetical protein